MLLERQTSLAELNQIVERSRGRAGQIALVLGEPGIGKSSLLREFLGQSIIPSFALGVGHPRGTPVPLAPFAPLFADLDIVREKFERRDLLFDHIFSRLAKRGAPYLMAFDDLHWFDEASLDLLQFLHRRASGLPVAFVETARPEEVRDNKRLAALVEELPAGVTRCINLAPLSKSAVSKLCDVARYRDDVNALYRLSAGNPFYVTEVLEDRERTSVPHSIRDAVTARLSRLSDVHRELLEHISVFPAGVSRKWARKNLPQADDEHLSELIMRNFLALRGDDLLQFRHELARLATHARLSPTRLRKIHTCVLKSILLSDRQRNLSDGFSVEDVVFHAAGALDAQLVLAYAPRAAKRAASAGAHKQAAEHLSIALRFVDEATPQVAAEIYESWAYEAGLALEIDDEVIEARRHAVTLWRALDNPEKVAENLRWLSRLHWYRAETAYAARYSDEAVRILQDRPPSREKAMSFSLRSQMHMLNDHMDDAIVWGRKAIAHADEVGDTGVRIHALNNVGTARAFRGDEGGVEDLRLSLRLALEQGAHEDAARVYTNLAEYAVEFLDFKLAEEVLSEGVAFDTRNDLDSWTYYLVGRQAQLRAAQGRFEEARRIAEGVIDLDQLTLLMKLPARLVRAGVSVLQGSSDAETHLAQAFDHAQSTEEPQHIVPALVHRLRFAFIANRPEIAEQCLGTLREIDGRSMHGYHRGECAAWASYWNLDISPSYANARAEPFLQEENGQRLAGADFFESRGYLVGAALMLARDTAENPDALAHALQLSRASAMRGLETAVRSRARQLGVLEFMPKQERGPYRAASSHPAGLTAKEQVVLTLLLDGLSNQQISESLSRSRRTVENHVRSILKKLNANNRVEAVLRVRIEPWLRPQVNSP